MSEYYVDTPKSYRVLIHRPTYFFFCIQLGYPLLCWGSWIEKNALYVRDEARNNYMPKVKNTSTSGSRAETL